ncbi:MAG: TAXI family TRAP transporter solute-binding subunit [Candidatus Poribacteria bacterium]|nr:TAXI family TRAP transporter solute-binding subunit [Candidatus Poribacteria bacterium]
MRSKFIISIALLSFVIVVSFVAKLGYDRRHVYHLTIATAGKGGEYYAFGETLAQVITKHQPKIQIRVRETEGSLKNMILLHAKAVDFAIVQSDTPATLSARAVASLFPEMFHLIAAKEADIQRVRDLKGKRMAVMPAGSGSHRIFNQLIQHHGLTTEDFQHVQLRPENVLNAFDQGIIDAVFHIIGLGNHMTRDLLETGRVKLVPIDGVMGMRVSQPYFEATHIPQAAYSGYPPIPERNLPTASVRAMLLAHYQVDKSIVHEITRILYEHRNELVTANSQAATIRKPDPGEDLSLPLHPGAKAYYNKDKPGFLRKYADSMALMLSVIILIASGGWQFRLRLQQRQKNRADIHVREIVNLIDRARVIKNFEELQTVRGQLFDIFKKAIEDLDQDRISQESFQSLTFPWEMAISVIRHCEMLLMNSPGKMEVSKDLHRSMPQSMPVQQAPQPNSINKPHCNEKESDDSTRNNSHA